MSRRIGHPVIAILLALALGVGMTTSSSGCNSAAASSQQSSGHSGHDATADGDDGAPSLPCDGDCTGTMPCALVMSCSAVALVASGNQAIVLPMLARTTAIYTSPQDAGAAFYQAFEAQDIDAMMATWADDEDIVCVHPGGARVVGFDAVRAAWEQIFSGDTKLSFRLEHAVMIETVGLAMQSVIEHVYSADGTARGAAAATNIFMRTPSGWRLVCHHASPVTAVVMPQPTGPLH